MPDQDATPVLDLDPASRCKSCPRLARADPPPRERIASTDTLIVAHAFDASLEGWLVVVPLRHVVRVEDLDDDEVRELGPLLRATSAALRHAVGCEKTYVMQLAESAGFNHVHFHVVPRRADLPDAYRGPRVFGLLGDANPPVADARQDEIALAVREHLVAAGAARVA